MEMQSPEEFSILKEFDLQKDFTREGLAKINKILESLAESLKSNVRIASSLFELVLGLHERVERIRTEPLQAELLDSYYEYELKTTELLKFWHVFSKEHPELQPGIEEISLASIVKACANLLFLKEGPQNILESEKARSYKEKWMSSCFAYLKFFSEELTKNLILESFSGALAAYVANTLGNLCRLCEDFTEVQLSYTVLNRILIRNCKDSDFNEDFKLVPTILCISSKLKECLDYNILPKSNTLAQKSTISDANFENHILLEFYFHALFVILKSCYEQISTLSNQDDFEPDLTKFLFQMLFVNGCLISQNLQPKLQIQGSIASIRKINKLLYSLTDFSPVFLCRVFKNFEANKLATNDNYFLLGKFFLLSSILNSLSTQNSEAIEAMFPVSNSNKTNFCLLNELFSVLTKLSPAIWITSGLAQLSNMTGDTQVQSIYSLVVQNLTMSACILGGRFEVWETFIIKRFLSSNYLLFLCICEAWVHVWNYLPNETQSAHLESIIYLNYQALPHGQLYLRTKTLMRRLSGCFTNEHKSECSNKLTSAISGFTEDPMLLFSFCAVYPLEMFEDRILRDAVSTISQHLETIYTCHKLTSPALISLKEIFGLNLKKCTFTPQDIKRVAVFARRILSTSCSSRDNPLEEPKLIVACCELFSVAPLPMLEPVVLDIVGAIFQHINTSNTLFIHNSMISMLARCALLPLEGQTQASFMHFSKTILRRFFEDIDWAAHYGVFWHLAHIYDKPVYSDVLLKSIPPDVHDAIDALSKFDVPFCSPSQSYGYLANEFTELCEFFKEWLNTHPPPVSDLPSAPQASKSLYPKQSLPIAISQLEKLIESPIPIDPCVRQQLSNLSKLIERKLSN